MEVTLKEVFKCAHSKVVELHKLIPNPKNPNNHPQKQIDMLAKIIDYQGQRSPIVVSNRSGFITKGHGRLAALQKLGWEKAAVDFQDYESEAQEFADMVADNKIAELAEHDDLKMIEGLKELVIEDFELLGLDDFRMPVVTIEEEGKGDGLYQPENIQKISFILSHEQKDLLDQALEKATKEEDCIDDLNPNHDGNALTAIIKRYIYG